MAKSKSDSSVNSIPYQAIDSSPSYPLFPSAYSPKTRSRVYFDPATDRTKQSFKDECDINNIMRRFELTGQLDHVSKRQPLYGEIPATDFQSAMQLVVTAREQFALLPAEVRDRFGNDPGRLLAFLEDPANRAEGVKLGLLVERQGGGSSPPPSSAPSASDETAGK